MRDSHPPSIPAEDLLHEAASVACLAPSIANTQPWRWRIHGDTDRRPFLGLATLPGEVIDLLCKASDPFDVTAQDFDAQQIEPGGYPQLTLRAGVNESAPQIPAPPRRPAAEVIDKN